MDTIIRKSKIGQSLHLLLSTLVLNTLTTIAKSNCLLPLSYLEYIYRDEFLESASLDFLS